MYNVYLSNNSEETLIYNSTFQTPNAALINPVLKVERGSAGSFETTFPPNNMFLNNITKMVTEVVVKKMYKINGVIEEKEKWRGRILDTSSDFYNQLKVHCEGELTYLSDTFQPQREYKAISLKTFCDSIVSVHNSKVTKGFSPYDKTFLIGNFYITDSAFDTVSPMDRYTDYDTTFNILKNIADEFKAFWIVRKVYEEVSEIDPETEQLIQKSKLVRYIDLYQKDYGMGSGQRIDFGSNLLDFTISNNMSELCSVVLPTGQRLDEGNKNKAGEEIQMTNNTEHPEISGYSNFRFLAEPEDSSEGNRVYMRYSEDKNRNAGYFRIADKGVSAGDKLYFCGRNYGKEGDYNVIFWAQMKDVVFPAWSGDGVVAYGTSIKVQSVNGGLEYTDEMYQEIEIEEGCEYLFVCGLGEDITLKIFKADEDADKYDKVMSIEEIEVYPRENHPEDDPNIIHESNSVYLINKSLIDIYGWNEKKYSLTDVKNPQMLFEKAKAYLLTNQFEAITIEASISDLHDLGNYDVDDIWIDNVVNIYSKPHGITGEVSLPCTSIDIQLSELDKSKITLGYSTNNDISNASSQISSEISNAMAEAPAVTTILQSARNEATELFGQVWNEGYVYFTHADDNPKQITSIVISNNPNPDNATAKWIFDSRGIGYGTRNSVYESFSYETAITMNGMILGKFIAASSISGDRITGGTIKIGQFPYMDPSTGLISVANGTLEVYAEKDGNSVRIAAIEKDYGITSEAHYNTNEGHLLRIRDGRIIGKFFGSEEFDNRNHVSYNDGDPPENCTGVISFNSAFSTDEGISYGLDLRAEHIGLNCNRIGIRSPLDGEIYSTVDNEISVVTDVRLVDGAIEYKTHRLKFIHGMLYEIEDESQNE